MGLKRGTRKLLKAAKEVTQKNRSLTPEGRLIGHAEMRSQRICECRVGITGTPEREKNGVVRPWA